MAVLPYSRAGIAGVNFANVGRVVHYHTPLDSLENLSPSLLQDDAGGLEVKSRSRWVSAPPVPGSFVCNIGDMLDRMTGGLFRSTPHRVRNPASRVAITFRM